MKNVIARVFALTLCAAVVCALPAFAAEGETAVPEAGKKPRNPPGLLCKAKGGAERSAKGKGPGETMGFPGSFASGERSNSNYFCQGVYLTKIH